MSKNQVTIKIFGELTAIKAEATKIKNLHSIYLESEYMQNDDGETSRVYINVPAENKNANSGLVRQDQARTATAPQLSYSLTEGNPK